MSVESLKAKAILYQGTKAFLALTRKQLLHLKPADARVFMMQLEQLEDSLNEVYEQGDLRQIIQSSENLVHVGEMLLEANLEPTVKA